MLLIGDGDLRQQTEQQTKDYGLENHVKFLGVRLDVNELLQAADAMVFPSLFEGLPMTLVEAQCSGLPCVISENIPHEVAFTDLVEQLPLETGAEKWSEQLLQATTKLHERETYAQRVADAGYDIQTNAKWLENFYLQCQH